jgi:hypothetical protein
LYSTSTIKNHEEERKKLHQSQADDRARKARQRQKHPEVIVLGDEVVTPDQITSDISPSVDSPYFFNIMGLVATFMRFS